ncbi:VOC family protein [Bosea sp. 2RAB26]|uniref:VOC family protein n=1 Tax=Bosea sp. 2RAB26 TaxID=3237476 RepID=UPI003F9163FA
MTPLVTRQSYMALNVEDLDACVRDAESVLGLRIVDYHDGRAVLTATGRRAELMLHQASGNAARTVGLEALDGDAVEAAASRASAVGLAVLSREPSLPCIERSVTFTTSDGHVFEVHTPMPADQPRRYAGAGIHPRGICHVNLTSPDPWRIYGELHETLGLKISERTSGCELVWLRAADGRHHTVGIVKGARPGIHHYAWEFAQFNDFMRLGDVLDALDRVVVWGPGRHGAGDNLFAYYLDPAGFMVECSSEMEVIANDTGYEPKVADIDADLTNIKVVNRWGAPPPRPWIQHHTDFAVFDGHGSARG